MAAQLWPAIVWVLAGGAVALVLRLVLALVLRGRLAPELMPEATGPAAPMFFGRLVALIGMNGAATHTLGTYRLRTTLGLRLVLCALFGAMVMMQAGFGRLVGPETILVTATGWIAVQAALYEISYDRDTITLPRWWFGRTTRRWRDLDQAVMRDPLTMSLHFRDGQVIQAYKYVVGYPLLMETMRKAMRES